MISRHRYPAQTPIFHRQLLELLVFNYFATMCFFKLAARHFLIISRGKEGGYLWLENGGFHIFRTKLARSSYWERVCVCVFVCFPIVVEGWNCGDALRVEKVNFWFVYECVCVFVWVSRWLCSVLREVLVHLFCVLYFAMKFTQLLVSKLAASAHRCVTFVWSVCHNLIKCAMCHNVCVWEGARGVS